MLAGGECSLGGLAMDRRREADVDGVDLGVGEHRIELGNGGADGRGNARRPVWRLAHHRLHTHAVAERRIVGRVRRAHEAGADDRHRRHQRRGRVFT